LTTEAPLTMNWSKAWSSPEIWLIMLWSWFSAGSSATIPLLSAGPTPA
jgi:hypothetical protein